ncbi:unnamed protein product, partial [marine sediment metagenome]
MKPSDIKFRGYSERDSEWRYGFYVSDDTHHEILTRLDNGELYASPVDPDSIGQYIGMKDIQSNDIYTGDIAEVYKENGFTQIELVSSDTGMGWHMRYIEDNIKLIGNKYLN